MSVYFLGLVCSVVLLLLTTFTDFKRFRYLIAIIDIIVIAVVIFFAVNRALSVGTDYSSYQGYFYTDSVRLKAIGIEPLFRYFLKYAYSLGDFKIISFLTFSVFIIGYIVYCWSTNISLIYAMPFLYITYVMLSALNGIRQYMAIGILFVGLGFWNKMQSKAPRLRWIVFFALVVLAMQVHVSAVIGLVIPILTRIRVSYIKVVLTGAFCTALYFSNVGNLIINKLSVLFPVYLDKYGLNASMMMQGGLKGAIAFIPIAIQFVFLMISIRFNSEFNNENRLLINGYLFFLFLFMGAGSSAALRIQAVFSPFLPAFYAKLFESNFQNRFYLNVRTEKLIMLTFFTVYFIVKIFRNISGVVPYTFFM